MNQNNFYVVLFQSVSQAMKAEKVLKKAGIIHKLIPVPRHISSDCGVCLRFSSENQEEVKAELQNSAVPFNKIQPL